MNSKNHLNFYRITVILLLSIVLIQITAADVIEDNGHTYLIDQTGERWDITRALREFDVLWLEESIAPGDVAGHPRISREGGLSIAAGENFGTLPQKKVTIDAAGRFHFQS